MEASQLAFVLSMANQSELGVADQSERRFKPQTKAPFIWRKVVPGKRQGHPTDCFGRISVRKTCNRLKFSVREMSSRASLIKIN